MKAVFDACYITRASYFKSDCAFITQVSDDLFDECFASHEQYGKSYCKHVECLCTDLDAVVDDEAVVSFMLSFKHINRIYNSATGKDIYDVKILFFAKDVPDVLVCSCDYNLLFCCKKLAIPHECIKRTFINLCDKNKCNYLSSDQYDTRRLTDPNETDHLFNLHKNGRCNDCLDTPCDFSSYLAS